MPFLQNAGQKVNFLFALVAVLYLVLLTIDFVRYGGVIAPSWITAAFAIALGGWIGCRRSERLRGAARFCGTRRRFRRRADCAVLRRRPGRSRVRRARKRIRAQGRSIHATRRRRGTHIFRPRIRRIFHIGAVKTGHPTKTRMPGLFFIDFIGRNRLITSLYIFEWLLYVRSQHWKFCLVRSIRFFP